MDSIVYFNGDFIGENEAKLSAKDRSYLFGEGLFETIFAAEGSLPFWPEHVERLHRGIELLQFSLPLEASHLREACEELLKKNHQREAILRLTLSRENLNWNPWQASDRYNLLIYLRPLPVNLEELKSKGVRVVSYPNFPKAPNPLNEIKSTNYLAYQLAKQYALEQQAGEALLLDTQGRVVEGATSNLFIFSEGRWVTPPLDSGPLPGVTRQVVLRQLAGQGWPFEEAPLTLAQVLDSELAFLTNAAWGLVPITQIDGKTLRKSGSEQAFRKLQKLYAEEWARRLHEGRED